MYRPVSSPALWMAHGHANPVTSLGQPDRPTLVAFSDPLLRHLNSSSFNSDAPLGRRSRTSLESSNLYSVYSAMSEQPVEEKTVRREIKERKEEIFRRRRANFLHTIARPISRARSSRWNLQVERGAERQVPERRGEMKERRAATATRKAHGRRGMRASAIYTSIIYVIGNDGDAFGDGNP